MSSKWLVGAAGIFVALGLVGGTAMAVGGPSKPSAVEVVERASADSKEATTTTLALSETTTTDAPVTTTTVAPAPSVETPVVTKPQAPSVQKVSPTTTAAPKATTTTTDPKVALMAWWNGGASADWKKYQNNYFSSCHTTTQCQKFTDVNNKFSSDIHGIKPFNKTLYVNLTNKYADTIDALSRVYTCNVNGYRLNKNSSPIDCNKADKDSVDAYMAFVTAMKDAGLPVSMG